MKEIELSTMTIPECLHLEGFESRNFTRVVHQHMEWAGAWDKVLQIGLYQRGPDVSEVGSTWLENLVDMRALRPFSVPELYHLGGETAFLSNSWTQDTSTPIAYATTRKITSIPWSLNTRVILYRRDLLAKAGIHEAGAFATADAMHATLTRLQESGVSPYPLSIATGGLSIHNIASWVWGRGGRFRSADYHKITLVEPEARRGMQDFFSMHRFIAPQARGQLYQEAESWYFTGQAAVLFSGQWAMMRVKEHPEEVLPEVSDNTGYAVSPGIPFVGASHLVIWRHSLLESEANQLIQHLTSPDVLLSSFRVDGNFPARLQALNAPPFSNDADYRMISECIRTGRGFRSAHLWAGVEARLNILFSQLWKDVFANPELNLEAEIEQRVRDLADRLERTLLANW